MSSRLQRQGLEWDLAQDGVHEGKHGMAQDPLWRLVPPNCGGEEGLLWWERSGGTLFLVKGTRLALMLKGEEKLNPATWALAQDVLFCGLRRYGTWNPELAGLCGSPALPLETSGQGICLY